MKLMPERDFGVQRPLSLSHRIAICSYCINSRNGGNQCQERRWLYLPRRSSGIPKIWREHVSNSCQPRR